MLDLLVRLRVGVASEARVGLRRFFLFTARTLFWRATICGDRNKNTN